MRRLRRSSTTFAGADTQRKRERRRERNRERNSRKGHGTKQPLQGRGLRQESQSEGEVLRTATSAAAEAARDEERAGRGWGKRWKRGRQR